MHSFELEVQVLQGKLAAAGRDMDTMKENLTSRVTLLEGKLNESQGCCYLRVTRFPRVV